MDLRPVRYVFARNEHASRVRLQKSHNMLERDRFPHAAASHDDARLPAVHMEADVIEDKIVVERFADVAKFDVVVAHRLSFFRRAPRFTWSVQCKSRARARIVDERSNNMKPIPSGESAQSTTSKRRNALSNTKSLLFFCS